MHITEWRKQSPLVARAHQQLEDPMLKQMLECLRDSNPLTMHGRLPDGSMVTGPEAHARLLGIVEGYHIALDFLHMLGQQPPPMPTQVLPTYAPDELFTVPVAVKQTPKRKTTKTKKV